jgi:NAD-reducing hydrogenase small subunit
MTTTPSNKVKLATAWFGGCAGCHMSLLDLDERMIDVVGLVDIVYSPIADIKVFPEGVDVTLVEGAICNDENLHLAHEIRERSKIVIAFGDCAVTGNVPSMRNRLDRDEMIASVYSEGPGKKPPQAELGHFMPTLMPKVLPLHQVIPVDIFLPGCPPAPERIWAAIVALLKGEPVLLPEEMRSFG